MRHTQGSFGIDGYHWLSQLVDKQFGHMFTHATYSIQQQQQQNKVQMSS
jgi:hypothetical protein